MILPQVWIVELLLLHTSDQTSEVVWTNIELVIVTFDTVVVEELADVVASKDVVVVDGTVDDDIVKVAVDDIAAVDDIIVVDDFVVVDLRNNSTMVETC